MKLLHNLFQLAGAVIICTMLVGIIVAGLRVSWPGKSYGDIGYRGCFDLGADMDRAWNLLVGSYSGYRDHRLA